MAQIDLGFEFRRSNKKPLDISSVWYSYQDALDYAAGLNLEKGAPYAGQHITVIENGETRGFIITEDGGLNPIGEGSGGGGSIANIVSDDESILAEKDEMGIFHLSLNQVNNPEIEIEI